MTSIDGFEYRVEHYDDRSVVALIGELDFHTAQSLAPSIDPNHGVVVLNLSCVEFIDVAGMRRLLQLRDTLQRQGKEVHFQQPSRVVTRITEVLQIEMMDEGHE